MFRTRENKIPNERFHFRHAARECGVWSGWNSSSERTDEIERGKSIEHTLESSWSAFSRRSGLLSSRTRCSTDAILRSFVAETEEAPKDAPLIEIDCGKFAID